MQPANVATPAETATVALVHVSAALAGVEGCVIVNAMVPVLVVVTVLPPRSCTATIGCAVNAAPPGDAFGEVVKPIVAAVPTEIVKLRLVAGVSGPSSACTEYVPARSIRQPVNVATPFTAGSGVVFVQLRSAPAGVVIVSVTPLASAVTVLPATSSIVTTGCVPKAMPPVEELGEVVNASFVAPAAVMLKVSLVAGGKPPSTACKE